MSEQKHYLTFRTHISLFSTYVLHRSQFANFAWMEVFASETGLLQSFRLGQPAAFRHIYHLYMRQLCFFVEQVTGDTIVSEDIVADTFITTFHKKEDFDDLNKLLHAPH